MCCIYITSSIGSHRQGRCLLALRFLGSCAVLPLQETKCFIMTRDVILSAILDCFLHLHQEYFDGFLQHLQIGVLERIPTVRLGKPLKRFAMARIPHAIGRLVLLYMAALLVVDNPCPMTHVEAYEVRFGNETLTDLAKGGIDVASLITEDWLFLPLGSSCGLGAKYITPHFFNTSTTRGRLHTTFEFLTTECTAEYKHDINTCAVLSADFAACMSFPFDSRTSHSPWGYCSNQNFRVSYLWVPDAVSNVTTTTSPTPMASWKMTTQLRSLQSNLQISSSTPPTLPSVCSSYGQRNKTSTDPVTLANMYKDVVTLSRVAKARIGAEAAATNGKSCDWRNSNLIPVAYDGVQNVLKAGQSLHSSDGLYMLTMQYDCNLVLYKSRTDGTIEWNGKWATFSQFNDPFQRECSLELQPDGNLVVRDPSGNPRWSSGSTTPALYSTALAVISCGNVIVLDMTSGAIIWATHTGHA